MVVTYGMAQTYAGAAASAAVQCDLLDQVGSTSPLPVAKDSPLPLCHAQEGATRVIEASMQDLRGENVLS